MSEKEYETEERSAVGPAALGFVIGLVLAAAVLYFIMIAPRNAEQREARETIVQLEHELAQLDGRDTEIQEAVASLEAELEGNRANLLVLQENNERLETELAEARAHGSAYAESVEGLESELAELRAAMATVESRIEQTLTEKETLESELQDLQAALEDREAEIEEMREAYLVAIGEVERAEAERDELREQTQREITSLRESAAALQQQPAPRPQSESSTQPHRYINLLTGFYAARQEGLRADDPQQARAAWDRAAEILDTIEEEFPDRPSDRLRQDLQSRNTNL